MLSTVSSDAIVLPPIPPRREAREAAAVSNSKTRNAGREPATLVRSGRDSAEWAETEATSANAGDTVG
jgi:hypothetical protein